MSGQPEPTQAFLQSVIDGLAEPIMVIGSDFQVTLMNRAARQFAGREAKEVGPWLCYQMSHRSDEPCRGDEHHCPLEQVRESGQPVTVVHQHYAANGEPRIVEVIAAPLRGADGTCLGVIESLHDITERQQAEEALQQYAQRLQALAARLSEVAELERQRLARELHDQVGQNLTALGINLNILMTQMPVEDTALRSRLKDCQALVEQTAERIRDLMADLRPPVLDDYGLVAALHWYGEQVARRSDTTVVVEGTEPVPRMPPQVENALFRIAQEALTNVVKHAQATQVGVRVELEDEALRMIVADNGLGFDPSQLSQLDTTWGWGMLTMTERAEAVGGRCRVESRPGQGTRVIVEVPL